MGAIAKQEAVYFSAKGQVVIPQRLRREFEIKKGTKAFLESTPEGILVKPVTAKLIRRFRGRFKGTGVLKALMESRKAEREN